MGIANMQLAPPEIRVLGCLMEKQRTTPDAYPLSMNALRLACNQSTNRDPVTDYDEQAIRLALHQLERRQLTRLASGAGSRAAKYRHLLAQALPLDEREHAILCVLMLRGPQTPGELKQRTERMHAFAVLEEVQEALRGLIARELVQRMDRRPGQKEERYRQLLGEEASERPQERRPQGEASEPHERRRDGETVAAGGPDPAPSSEPDGGPAPAAGALADLLERVTRLESQVAELRGMRDPMGEGPQ